MKRFTKTDAVIIAVILALIAGIVILSRLLGEAWLLDVALIYTMISLVSVLILARVLIPPRPSRRRFRDEPGSAEQEGENHV